MYDWGVYWVEARCCAFVNLYRRFWAMKEPNTTPVNNVIPASSHFLKLSCDLLLSAAASFPKISAKRSCLKKDREKNLTHRKRKTDTIPAKSIHPEHHFHQQVLITPEATVMENSRNFHKCYVSSRKFQQQYKPTRIHTATQSCCGSYSQSHDSFKDLPITDLLLTRPFL